MLGPADATHPPITPAPSSSSPVSSTAVSAPEATPRSSTFHFVNVEGPRTEYRSAARAHVMRRVNKERDEARRYNEAVSRDMSPIRIASAVDLFRTVDMKHFDHCTSTLQTIHVVRLDYLQLRTQICSRLPNRFCRWTARNRLGGLETPSTTKRAITACATRLKLTRPFWLVATSISMLTAAFIRVKH